MFRARNRRPAVTPAATAVTARRAASRPAVEPLESRQLMSAGGFDPGFGDGTGIVRTEVQGAVKKMLLQSDGKVVVLATDGRVARFNADGSLDTGFGAGGTDGDGIISPLGYGDPAPRLPRRQSFLDVALQGNDKLVVTGTEMKRDGLDQLLVARFTTAGARDTSFNGTGVVAAMVRMGNDYAESGNAVMVDAAGRIVVSDRAVRYNGDRDVTTIGTIVRFNADGSRDGAFGSGGLVPTIACRTSQAYYDADQMAQAPDGTYVVAQAWPQGNSFYAIRLDNGGNATSFVSVPTGLTGGNSPTLASLAVTSDGNVFVGGTVKGDNVYTQQNRTPFLMRLTPSLSYDYGFNAALLRLSVGNQAFGQVRGVLPQADGKVFAAVTSGSSEGGAVAYTRRLNSAGSIERTDDSATGYLLGRIDQGAAVMRDNGKLMVAGTNRGNITFVRLLNDVGGVTGTVKVGATGKPGVTVYDDANNNGTLDAGEARALTNPAGRYRIVGLTPGSHRIRERVPTGFAQTTPGSGQAITVTVTANQAATDKNFVLASSARTVAPNVATPSVLVSEPSVLVSSASTAGGSRLDWLFGTTAIV